jgi:hypothetical protein
MKAELIRKVPPFAVPTDLAEIQAGMEVPDVCISSQVHRLCQTVGPGKAPRRQTATKCNVHINASRSTEETKKGREARKNRGHRQQNDQGSGLINCNREGGKTEKQHQRDLVRKNSDEQKTQVKPTDNKPPNLG